MTNSAITHKDDRMLLCVAKVLMCGCYHIAMSDFLHNAVQMFRVAVWVLCAVARALLCGC